MARSAIGLPNALTEFEDCDVRRHRDDPAVAEQWDQSYHVEGGDRPRRMYCE